LLSLLIALSGGLPGILAFADHLRKRIKFDVQIPNFITFGITGPNVNKVGLLLTVTATNAGERPLAPAFFLCALRRNGKWHQLTRWLIPEGAIYQGETQTIELTEPARRDLQRFHGTIEPSTPAIGFLMFVADPEVLNRTDPGTLSVRLQCVDVFGKTHSAIQELKPDAVRANLAYPHHGITVGVPSSPPSPVDRSTES
jgi:hypothetical protein